MSRTDYLYCRCGSVSHPDYAAEFQQHLRKTGHTPMAWYEVRWHVLRFCCRCNRERGIFAISGDNETWVCRGCVESAVERVGA